MNRFDNMGGEARLVYGDGEYSVVKQGSYVVCAVTGKNIPLDRLRYWSVDLQEAYATPEASLQRYRETQKD
ncbi:hypothetical protein FHS78_002107 [Parvibaculum indicum]|uniref:DUF2093 domain-containing protein n=1 Tax=Parvibaculum indicum TaxID=562969 RepID=UPI00142213BD|nr:DUF2093 domain-containing protein [Parvibaculum indicum]NIJ41817.1 hypothetical protein [Parvibaculum indicum]